MTVSRCQSKGILDLRLIQELQRNQELLRGENKVSVKAEGILNKRSKGEAGVLGKTQASGLSSWVGGGDIHCARQEEGEGFVGRCYGKMMTFHLGC